MKKRKTSLRRLIVVWGILVVMNVILYVTSEEFLISIGEMLLVDDKFERADVIVVFGGGERTERVDHAIYLYEEKYADYLFFSGGIATKGTSTVPWALRMRQYAEQFVPAERIYVDSEAESTYDNAKHTVAFMKERGFQSAIVVTSPYHMKRSLWTLGQVCKAEGVNMTWIPNASTKSSVTAKDWWKDEWTRRTLLQEYIKIIFYRIRYAY